MSERDAKRPKEIEALLARVEADGGAALASYREPIGGRWQIFCLLPIDKVTPTPYQRDLSPAHTKRLTEVVKRIDRFVDPIVVVSVGVAEGRDRGAGKTLERFPASRDFPRKVVVGKPGEGAMRGAVRRAARSCARPLRVSSSCLCGAPRPPPPA